ncbi:MAG: MerR family transcriptional regulator [Coprobacillus sp.]
MKTKEVCDKYHVSRKALRLYEEKGFIKPSRDESFYRDYSEDDLEIIKKIILLRKMEFSLEEIEKVIFQKDNQLILRKKEEFNKDIHFIETKKLYLDYICSTIEGEYEIDETIEAVEETIKIYENDEYKDMIQFDFHKDTIGLMWLTSFIIAMISLKWYLIVSSVVMGLVAIILSLKSVRRLFLRFPLKRMIAPILIIVGAMGIIITSMNNQDTLSMFVISSISVVLLLGGISITPVVKKYYDKYQNIVSSVLCILSAILIGYIIYFDISNMLAFGLVMIAFETIVLCVITNKMIREIFIGLITG